MGSPGAPGLRTQTWTAGLMVESGTVITRQAIGDLLPVLPRAAQPEAERPGANRPGNALGTAGDWTRSCSGSLAAQSSLPHGSAEADPHRQLGVEARAGQETSRVLVRGNVPDFWIGCAQRSAERRYFLAMHPPERPGQSPPSGPNSSRSEVRLRCRLQDRTV